MKSNKWLIICGFLIVGSNALAQQFDEEEDFFDPPIEQTQVAPTVKVAPVAPATTAAKVTAAKPARSYAPPAPKSEDPIDVAPSTDAGTSGNASAGTTAGTAGSELIIRVHQQYDPATENSDNPDRQYIEVYATDGSVAPFTCVTSTGIGEASKTDNDLPGETTTYESANHANAPDGYFTIFRMEEHGKSDLFEGDNGNQAPMPFKMSFNGGIAFHQSNLRVDGRPASHGCARLKRECAEKLFRIVETKFGGSELIADPKNMAKKPRVRVYVEGQVVVDQFTMEKSLNEMNAQLKAVHVSHLRNGTQREGYAPNEIWVYGRRYVKNEQTKVHLPDGEYVETVDNSDNGYSYQEPVQTAKKARARKNSFDSVVNGVGEGVGGVFSGIGDVLSAPFKKKKCLTLDGDKMSCKKLIKQGRCINDDNEEIPCSGKKKKNSNGMY